MNNLLKFPILESQDSNPVEKEGKLLPFKKKQGLMIDTSFKEEVFCLEDFFQEEGDVFFMG